MPPGETDFQAKKGLISEEIKPFIMRLVEISGIESPPGTRRRSAAVAAIGLNSKRSAVYGLPISAKENSHLSVTVSFGGDKRDRTADLLNAIERLATFCSEKVREIANIKSF